MGTVTSTGSGNWSTDAATCWDSGSRPGDTDDVVILNTHNITVSQDERANSIDLQTGGTLTVTGSRTIVIDSEDSGGYALDLDGAIVHSDGASNISFTIETPAPTSIDMTASSGKAHNLTINNASCICNAETTVDIGGILTISAGEFKTNNNALTVAGDIVIGDGSGSADTAILTGGSSTIVGNSLHIHSDGKYDATSGNTTLDGEGDGNNGTNNGFALHNNGTFTHNSGLVTITTNTNTVIYGMEGDDTSGTGANAFNDLTVNLQDSATYYCNMRPSSGTAINIVRDVVITQGKFYQETATHTLTIGRDVHVAANGTFGKGDGTISGNITVYSINIESGGTYDATTGTTSITGGGTPNYIGFSAKNGHTFNHNNGTVQFDTGSDESWITTNTNNGEVKFHNLIINGTNVYLNKPGLACDNDFTINAGKQLRPYNQYNSITVKGHAKISGTLGKTAWGLDEPSAAVSFGSLEIPSGGTYIATQQTTTINGGFHNNGTYTHNGGTIEMGGTGSVVNALPPKLTINNQKALYFSGGGSTGGLSNDNKNVVTMGDNDLVTTGSLNISAWVYPQAAADGGTVYGAQIIGKQANYNANTLGYGLYWAHDSRRFYFNIGDGSNGDRLNSPVYPEDEWYHVVGTYNSSTKAMVLWVNGVSVDTGTATSCGDLSASNSNILKLGGNGSTATDGDAYFTGYIADARLYAYGHDEAGVNRLGSKMHIFDPHNDNNYNLTAMWACNEGTGHTIADGHDAGTEYDGTYQRNGSNYSTDIWKSDRFTTTLLPAMTDVDTLEVKSGVLDLDSRTYLDFEAGDSADRAEVTHDTSGFSSVSVSAWVNFETLDDAYRGIVQCSDDQNWNDGFGLTLTEAGSGKLGFWVDAVSDAAEVDISTLSTSRWYHLVGTYDGTDQKLYIDGVLKDTEADTWSNKAASGSKIKIGCGVAASNGNDFWFDGKIRDVRIYKDFALTADQVASLYSGNYNVTPYLAYKLDEGSGNASGWGTANAGGASDAVVNGADWVTANFKVNGSARIGTNGSML